MTDEELHVLLHELREKQAHERAKLVQEPPAEPAEPDPAPEPDTGFRITESADAAEENTRILQAADAGQDDTAETDAMPFADYEAAVPAKPPRHLFLKIAACLTVLCFLAFSVFCIVRDIALGTTAGGGYVAGNVIQVELKQHDKPETDETMTDANGRYTYAGIAQKVMPSIVEIYTYTEGKLAGTGSGIILTKDGYIATNAHVVNDAESLSVKLFDDGREDESFEAAVIGHDTKTDLAVIKISASGLTPAALGDSDQVQLGESVCALGNPAGLSGSITTGIISGMNRKVRASSTNFEMDCFQTDAAISPGNSGGALVNMYGQVIGITSSKYSASVFSGAAYEGLGFAITINEALPILKELMEQGYVSGRVRVGISFLEHAAALQQAEKDGLKLPDPLMKAGVLVLKIDEDSDLNNTVFRIGDWIITMNGREVLTYDDLNQAIRDCAAGDSVHCHCGHINEDGTFKTFEIDFRLLEDKSGNY